MTTKERYDEIINYRKNNPLPKTEYGERHHIRPKSLGGDNSSENLIRLTPEEHYKCHCLLPYIYLEEGNMNGYEKMLHAWRRLSESPQTSHPDLSFIDKDSEEYGKIRRDYIEMQKLQDGFWKGKKMSDEARKNMAVAKKGRHLSEETRRKMSESHKGKVKTSEHRRHLSESLTGKHKSEEHKLHNSESHRGQLFSKEAKENLSQAQKRRWEEWRKQRNVSQD